MARPGRRHDQTIPPSPRSTPPRRPRSPRATPRRTTRIRRRAARRSPARCSWSARIEAVAGRADLTLKAGERALKDVRTALGSLPQLPSKKDYDDLMKRFKAAQTALMPKVQELRDIADWQRWANVGIQEQLCEKMEALKALEDPEEIAKQVRDLQQQWRQAADVPRAQGEALWKRFKAAHDDAWTRCEAHFAAQAEARAGNLASKVALCERAEALAESTNWIQTADEIKKLQAEWKTIGPVSRGQEKSIWERFRSACDRFFTRRHADLAERKTRVGGEPREERSAVREGGGAARLDRLGGRGGRDEAAAGRVEDDRPGEEEPLGGDVAAVPRRRAIISSRATPSATTSRSAERVAAREAICAELEGLARQSPVVSGVASRQSTSNRQSNQRPESAIRNPQSAMTEPPADLMATCARCADGGRRRSPRAASIAIARSRSTSASRRRSPPSSRAGRRSSAAPISIPTRTARRWKRSSSGSKTLAKSLGGPASAGRRRGAVADDAAGGDAEGSAGRQHDRRQGGRRQPVPRRDRRRAAGAGGVVAHRSGAGSGAAARSPIASSAPPAASPTGDGQKRVLRPILISSTSNTSMPYGAALARRRRASRESRSASSRLRPSAAAPSVQPGMTPSSANVAG